MAELRQLLPSLERLGAPIEAGLQIASPAALPGLAFDPSWSLLLLPGDDAPPAAAYPGRATHGSDPLALLCSLYGAGHSVRALDDTPDSTLGELRPADLARPWLVPPLDRVANLASPHGLPWLAARLRAPDGCPWDREQTHASLKRFLLEEAYEVYDALDRGATPALAEELGDLLLQVVLHAEYAAEAGVFDLSDVYRAIMAKIVRRHPHVFGDVVADSVDQVVRNWERIKADERAAGSESPATGPSGDAFPAAFAGLSRSLPALAYAQEMQERAASLGFDWPDVAGVIDKIAEEARELEDAGDPTERSAEYGDLLFVIVNLARRIEVDAEAALRAASAKFGRRFATVERLAGERGLALGALDSEALDELWRAAKRTEQGAVVG